MCEQEEREQNVTGEGTAKEPVYLYRWSYEDQVAHDKAKAKKEKRSGGLVFACVMTVSFLLVLGLLVGVLAFRSPSGNALTTEEVADAVLPATVLVYSANSTTYGYGTGFFVRSDGYIVTNYHVISSASRVSVTLYPSEKVLEASVVGYSSSDDIAVLKVSGSGYPTVQIGDSDAIRVGDTAIAIGNPAGINAPWTTTQGIISSTGRSVTVNGTTSIGEMNMIQTDAPVNPGNSGGPLCNDHAEVIGIVTQKLSDYESIGFAIPINGAMEIVDSIIRTGNADSIHSGITRVRPTIGITGSSIEKGDDFTYMGTEYISPADGVLVVSVSQGSGADGILSPGDIIVGIDEHSISGMDELIELLYNYSGGDQITLTVYQLGETTKTSVKLTLGVAN